MEIEMFLDNVAYEGMKVVMNMDKEARSWGRKGPPDGSTGTLLKRLRYKQYSARYGLDRKLREPGIYERDGGWYVKMDDPSTVTEDKKGIYFGSGSFDVHPESKQEYDKRAQELWYGPVIERKEKDYFEQSDILENRKKIGDLPDTKAWELDEVILRDKMYSDGDKNYKMIVTSIGYREEGNIDFTAVAVDEKGRDCFSVMFREEDIKEIKRGNLWKYEHGQEVTFETIAEEASFYAGLGKSSEMKNPKTGNYHWELEEFLEAVKEGTVDCMKVVQIPFSTKTAISVYRFEDRDLGERLRKETMKGFNLETDDEEMESPKP